MKPAYGLGILVALALIASPVLAAEKLSRLEAEVKALMAGILV